MRMMLSAARNGSRHGGRPSLSTDRGCVYISPLRGKSALKIIAESFNEETAEELCMEFERRAREIDS
jgi:hypothetical protein